ncbi:MAG: cob(I)yrinic acid a,c-diamide adenosyltransferase, partial [Actinomycetota bacterium]
VKIYTKTGDDGTTGLLFGGRVPKDDLRTEAYGSTDETVALLGLARAHGPVAEGLADFLLDLQRQLFVVGAELATARENTGKLQPGVSKVTDEMVTALEAAIDRMTAEAPLPDHFIVPGSSTVSATLDVARSVIRRAERSVVAMARESLLGDDCVLRYLNRLSDLLFVAARFEEHARGLHAPASREDGRKGRSG